MSDITNPAMDDEPGGSSLPEAAPGDENNNPPMDDQPADHSGSGSSIENPPA